MTNGHVPLITLVVPSPTLLDLMLVELRHSFHSSAVWNYLLLCSFKKSKCAARYISPAVRVPTSPAVVGCPFPSVVEEGWRTLPGHP